MIIEYATPSQAVQALELLEAQSITVTLVQTAPRSVWEPMYTTHQLVIDDADAARAEQLLTSHNKMGTRK
jgi:hypothetical protein